MPCTFSRLKCNLVFSLKIILIIIMILHRSLWQICNKKKEKAYSKELAFFLIIYTGKEWMTTAKMLINSFWIEDKYYYLHIPHRQNWQFK